MPNMPNIYQERSLGMRLHSTQYLLCLGIQKPWYWVFGYTNGRCWVLCTNGLWNILLKFVLIMTTWNTCSLCIPCILKTTGPLSKPFGSSWWMVKTIHVTVMLLYFSIAGTCKEEVVPAPLSLISGVIWCDRSDPLTIQPTNPVVALQLKVAVDPSVALTDVGVVTNSGIAL